LKAPVTDITLGIKLDHETKFRDVRKRARDEYIERAKKRKKDKEIPVPQHRIGDLIIYQIGMRNPHYNLMEVVDFVLEYRHSWKYYGILINTTDKEQLNRISRLTDTGGWRETIINVPINSIKWLI